MMAAVQQKLFPGMGACVAQWVDPLLGGITEPDTALATRYVDAFTRYKQTRETMRPIWRAMMDSRRTT
jgi:erythritol kinase